MDSEQIFQHAEELSNNLGIVISFLLRNIKVEDEQLFRDYVEGVQTLNWIVKIFVLIIGMKYKTHEEKDGLFYVPIFLLSFVLPSWCSSSALFILALIFCLNSFLQLLFKSGSASDTFF